jgi:peptidoglycan hydrolase-like protein with peptidoglycan-binding domain
MPASANTFRGRLIKRGERDAALVRRLQRALAARGYGPAGGSFTAGVFNAEMERTLKLFQAQNVDASGQPLKVDGQVGPFTWGALFPAAAPQAPTATGASALMLQSLATAVSQIGTLEEPLGSNRGPRVDQYLKSTGTPLGSAWCMAFVYWCFEHAAGNLAATNPLPRTAGCLDHWNKAARMPAATRHTRADVYANPALARPGQIFIMDFGGGTGHTGIVEALLPGGWLRTVEGNTNTGGSRQGLGVFRLERRKISDPMIVGVVEYA